jgi:hypothetical protein
MIVGTAVRRVIILDWKTGDDSDAELQIALYASAHPARRQRPVVHQHYKPLVGRQSRAFSTVGVR